MEVQLETGPCNQQKGSKISGDPASSFSFQGDGRSHATWVVPVEVGDLASTGPMATGRPPEGAKSFYVKQTDTTNNNNTFKLETNLEDIICHTEKCLGNRCSCCKYVIENKTINCTISNKNFKAYTNQQPLKTVTLQTSSIL